MPRLPSPLKPLIDSFRFRHKDGLRPLVLGLRRIYIVPSAGGFLYLLMLLTMLITAINYKLSLGYLFVFFLFSIHCTAMAHSFRNLYQLSITPGNALPVFAGESAFFSLQLDNPGRYSRHALDFFSTKDDRIRTHVDALTRRSISLPVSAKKRGWLSIPRITIRSGYPLELFSVWGYLQFSSRTLIYPCPSFFPLPEKSYTAAGAAGSAVGQDDFAGFKNREPADPLHHVAWKIAAKNSGDRPLLIKKFSGGGVEELQLSLDNAAGSTLEEKLSCLCGWVLSAEENAIPYSLLLSEKKRVAGLGEEHKIKCLQELALFGITA